MMPRCLASGAFCALPSRGRVRSHLAGGQHPNESLLIESFQLGVECAV